MGRVCSVYPVKTSGCCSVGGGGGRYLQVVIMSLQVMHGVNCRRADMCYRMIRRLMFTSASLDQSFLILGGKSGRTVKSGAVMLKIVL